MNNEFELRDNFDGGRISLLSEQRTPLLPLKNLKVQSQPSAIGNGTFSDRYIPLRGNQNEAEALDLLLDISLEESGGKHTQRVNTHDDT